MKDFPDLIILANRAHIVAYRTNGGGHLNLVDSLESMEGNMKISDLVTDQAAAFPTDEPGTAAYEDMPLTEELEIRSLRQIAGKIDGILSREEPGIWGFAAAPELNEAILEQVDDEHRDRLACNLRLDLTKSPPAEVHGRFAGENRNATSAQ